VPDRAVERDERPAGDGVVRGDAVPDDALPDTFAPAAFAPADFPPAALAPDPLAGDGAADDAAFALDGRLPDEPPRAPDPRPLRPGEAAVGSSGWASTGPPYPAAEDPSDGRLPYYESGTLRQRPGVRYRPEGKLNEAHRGVIAVPTQVVRAAFP
jgi:hypothetical protein